MGVSLPFQIFLGTGLNFSGTFDAPTQKSWICQLDYHIKLDNDSFFFELGLWLRINLVDRNDRKRSMMRAFCEQIRDAFVYFPLSTSFRLISTSCSVCD